MIVFERLKTSAKRLKAQVCVLYYAARHPRTPWYAKLVILAVVAYALSPVDLIPDFIPILGYLDDLVILPLGIALALSLIPKDIIDECAERANKSQAVSRKNWRAAAVIVAVWVVTIFILGRWLWSFTLAVHQ